MTLLELGAWDWLQPTFQHPGRLWLMALVPLGIVLYIVASRRRGRAGMRFTNTSVLGKVIPKQRQWLRHVAVVCSLLSLLTLAVAFAIPMAEDRVPQERATIVVVIDTSRSMAATDIRPNRLDAAKEAAKEYVTKIPKGYNIALVQLVGNASLRMPPVADASAAQRAIDVLELGDSTAIGDSIVVALEAISQAPKGEDGSVAPAAIVMLSDGDNTTGRSPQQAAQRAKKAGVPIHTVAYGSDLGYVDLDGKRELVPPNTELMRELAASTGGTFHTADDTDSLRKAYEELTSEAGFAVVPTEVTARWAGLGLVFAVLAAFAAVLMAARTT